MKVFVRIVGSSHRFAVANLNVGTTVPRFAQEESIDMEVFRESLGCSPRFAVANLYRGTPMFRFSGVAP